MKIHIVSAAKPPRSLNAVFPALEVQRRRLRLLEKNTIQHIERDEKDREAFVAELEALSTDNELFYCDESVFDKYYAREYGHAPRGEKAAGKVKGRRYVITSVVAAEKGDEIIAPFAFSGHMDADLFEGWLEYIFEICEDYGFSVIFLPKYSPDLNPIEKLWANIKRRLRLRMYKFDNFWDALAHVF